MSGTDLSVAGLISTFESRVRAELGELEAAGLFARVEQVYLDLVEPIRSVYGDKSETDELICELVGDAIEAALQRPAALRVLDRRREVDPGWFQRSRMVGYVCYVDRFAGDLNGVRARLDYLAELGVTYLHLMPLLEPRPGDNDGGYAVADYDAVDPRVGTMADLEALADDVHSRGMALCIDLVLNHTAREHEWAQRAIAGEQEFRDYYFVYPDRELPDAYERTLPEVFPDQAPGSFTHFAEMGGWVWTTFYDFQWDLNYANPAVFRAMTATTMRLANHGVDVLRLDAVPFLWKRMGTNCQNQPEAHLLTQALRALTRIAAPGLALKAEAIVAPDMLVQYLGGHDRYRPECDLAYDNQLMVMLWSMLATRDVRLAASALSRKRAAPLPTSWVCYVRCHDDIGWAIAQQDAAAAGLSAWDHQNFLNDFYSGRHPGSFARGALFQYNPATGDARISGAAASLCGVETALAGGGAPTASTARSTIGLDMALRRLQLLYSVAFSFGGIPLIYMGDELALRNDPHWADEPGHGLDNRWMHRPHMDWDAAARRTDPGSIEGRAFGAIRGLVEARRGILALRAGGETTVLTTDNATVLAYQRGNIRSSPFLAVANFSDYPQSVDPGLQQQSGLIDGYHVVHSTAGLLVRADGRWELPAWGFAWLTGR